eukprot:SAG22_NODE_2100_length_3015_cov_2.342250_2_plen_49_part_00
MSDSQRTALRTPAAALTGVAPGAAEELRLDLGLADAVCAARTPVVCAA